ncbi:hypothetical protein HHI36_004758, partial [Cryptolaemus montrouzieri]
MEALNEIAKRQQEVGDNIQVLWINMKKDASSRNNAEYISRRPTTILELQKNADQNHTEALKDENKEHEYFKLDFFRQ